jgi:hypothetical protein
LLVTLVRNVARKGGVAPGLAPADTTLAAVRR